MNDFAALDGPADLRKGDDGGAHQQEHRPSTSSDTADGSSSARLNDDEPIDPRKLTPSCSRCRAKKLKCDTLQPCSNCIAKGLEAECKKDQRIPRGKKRSR